ncbi:hypothetical protein [Sphingopyxis sp. MSC1_008]|uniref:hypothetical protein n=1 Tax=Sphingopyxis sp. MSC1_008 TaxID=2909265 RepID=UPI0020BD93BD|nr:hypothetical protein [Sphingopyxis sp. MSC1_008]
MLQSIRRDQPVDRFLLQGIIPGQDKAIAFVLRKIVLRRPAQDRIAPQRLEPGIGKRKRRRPMSKKPQKDMAARQQAGTPIDERHSNHLFFQRCQFVGHRRRLLLP